MSRRFRATASFPLQRPYPVASVLRWLAAHALPGLESIDLAGLRHRRSLAAPSGPAVIGVDFSDPLDIRLTMGLARASDAAVVEAAVRAWLDLDAPTEQVEAHLGATPLLAPMIAARPGVRVLGTLDGYETAVMTILGQHVSVSAARTFGGRLIAAYGGEGAEGYRQFPAPAAIAAASAPDLQAAVGATGARARTLVELSGAVADGRLILRPDADPLDARSTLLALPGVGPWTADYLALRVFRDHDAFPADDLIIKRALGVTRPKDAIAVAQQWRPYRGYAVIHLWTAMAFADDDLSGGGT